MNMQPIHIVIIGGGTSGWMAANMLAHHKYLSRHRVTVIESADISTVGVGEGSTPFFKQFFDQLGKPESEWMPRCHATYKTGIAFPGWLGERTPNSYFHPFYSEIDNDQAPVFMAACDARRQGYNIDSHPDSFFVTGHLWAHNRAPVNGRYTCDYGYHFDAGKLADYLRELAVERGVERKIATVETAEKHLCGDISSVILNNGERVEGTLFIDCSGFRGVLIKQALKRPVISLRKNLLCDAAVAFPVSKERDYVASATVSEAIDQGWVWNIPLTHRTGSGLVYSREHVSEDQAILALCRYHGICENEITSPVRLKWEPGKLTEHWHQNCVAIGLSQGFLEPLEAPMLNLTQQSINAMMEQLCSPEGADPVSFNSQVNNMIDGTCDYLQAHYLLNHRDGRFWEDVRDNVHMSGALEELLRAWRQGLSINTVLHKHVQTQVYLKTSWYCLLAGLNAFNPATRNAPARSQAIVASARKRAQVLARAFPAHKSVLNNKSMSEELNIA